MKTDATATLALILFPASYSPGGGPKPHTRFSSWASAPPYAHRNDRAGIAKLHKQDVAATLSGDPVSLADLFSVDGVLLEPGRPAVPGRAAILESDQQDRAQHPQAQVLSYKPDIGDLQIENGGAFEWDYFDTSYRESPAAPVKSFHAKALRVLKSEPDGSWKFARVMWNLAPEAVRQ